MRDSVALGRRYGIECVRSDVIIIGGGVVGLACANALLDAGRSVTVLEREGVGCGASHGNCGLITPSHALPLNRPGMVRKVLGWIGKADAPILLRPRLSWEAVSWGLRFMRNCRPETMLSSLLGRARLLEASRDMYSEWIAAERLACEWEELGLLAVFATPEAQAEADEVYGGLEQHGVVSERLDSAALLGHEPALRDGLAGARLWARDAHLRPDRLVAEIERRVREKGAVIEENCPVEGVVTDGARVTAVVTAGGPREADQFVLACGAWSPKLGRAFGVKLPVQPGKGYAITSGRPDPCPRYPLLLREANMGVTPWPSGLRLAGTMEFAGFDGKLRAARVEALRAGAKRYLKQPPSAGGEEWFGYRPMSPDELPIIDRVKANAVVATGHGMMGVSMAPATARLVAEFVTGTKPFVDPTPYRADRF
jgi:D-amino-acid dehydrogenase